MKRAGGIFPKIVDQQLLAAAFWRAAQGKRSRHEIREFGAQVEVNTNRLAAELGNGTFRFGGYRSFEIRDPKRRMIHAPSFRDRVVHHAIIAACGPTFERGAAPHSFACRAGKGSHAALQKLGCYASSERWFLKIDVRRYYDSIPQFQLAERLARRFRERRLLALFDGLLGSYFSSPGHGLPIGALTSQYLGNFYLDAIDHWVLQNARPRGYARYMDDMILISDTREELLRARDGITALLDGLGLRPEGSPIFGRCRHGIPALGFVVYPDRLRLNRLARRRLRRRWAEVERHYLHGKISEDALSIRSSSLFCPRQIRG